MKRLLLASVLLLAGIGLAAAQTAAPVVPGYYSTSGCVGASPCYLPYTSTNPLPTTATLSGTVTAATTGTASAAPTPVVAGTGKPLNISTNSELFSSLSIGGTVVPAGHGTAATALRVELPTDGTGVVGLNAGSAIVGKVGIDQTTPGSTNGVQITAATAATPVVSTSLEASHVLKGAAGSLYGVYASNLTGGTTGNLQVFNATSAPVDGAVTPLACVPFGNGLASISFQGIPPAAFSTGITAVISSATSCFTKTTGVLTGFIAGTVQ